MRDYSKVSPKFWTSSKTGKALRGKGTEAVIVGFYLMTSPHSNMLGLFYQPMLYMAHETGLGLEGASKGLQAAIDVGLCKYDSAAEMVWVIEMASYQIGEKLLVKDNRCSGIQKDYDSLPDCTFIGEFFDRYARDFHLSTRRGYQGPSEGPSKALLSQETEQETEQKQETEQETASLRSASSSAGEDPPGEQRSIPTIEAAREAKTRRLAEVTADAVETYNLAAFTKRKGGACANVQIVTDTRKAEVKRSLKVISQICERLFGSPTIVREFWEQYWGTVEDDDFHSGRQKPGTGHENWKPDFEYLTRPDTIAKLFDRAMSEVEGAAAHG
jgi:hypothetical protein